MKKYSIFFVYVILLGSLFTLQGCDLIVDIFSAGFWVGIILAVLVVVLIVWLFVKVFKRRK
jgi:uncharacterized membrane protein YcjF (UPF0283 family)